MPGGVAPRRATGPDQQGLDSFTGRLMMRTHLAATSEDERDLLARAAEWLAHGPRGDLAEQALRELAQEQGIDFATAVLYQSLRTSERHGPLIAALETPAADATRLDADIVVAPGAFYRDAAYTGADGAHVIHAARALGYRVETVPVANFGSVSRNADLLARWLLKHRHRPQVLVSHSKGTTEVRQALTRPDAAEVFRSVLAWVDLSGLYFGTPLVNWVRMRPFRWWMIRLLCWVKGYTFSALEDIARPPTGPRLERPHSLDDLDQMRILHIVGMPLQRHLSTATLKRGHRRLSPLGPNDGAIVLADVLALPGLVYPVWGADHFLRPAGRDLKTLVARVLQYLTAEPLSVRRQELV
jgi:hypothetical protein